MEAVDLLTGYADKLKRSAKELGKLEKAAKQLADKEAETEEQRYTLEERITEHRRDAAALQGEHQDLQLRYTEAVYLQDAHAQREAQTRRVEIEAALKEHGRALEGLSTALEALPSFETEAAEIAGEIEKLNFVNGSVFAANLRDALLKNESDLKSRQTQARKKLPAFSEETRLRVDAAYREEQERKGRARAYQAGIIEARMEENERKARTVTGIRRAQ